MRTPNRTLSCSLFSLLALLGCGPGAVNPDANEGDGAVDDAVDAAPADAPPVDVQPASTAHCTYETPAATGNAGGTVTEGEVRAGVAEGPLQNAIGGGLGAYTGRAQFLGSSGAPDRRVVEHSGWFNASGGYEIRPWARVLAITAGDEPLIIIKADGGAAESAISYEVARALGPQYAGKVIFAVNHSHGALGHTINNNVLAALGFGPFRSANFRRIVDGLVALARQAITSAVPARIGFAYDGNFDPMNRVNRDRRGENDGLAGGSFKDHHLYVMRVDSREGTPLALVSVFGMHGTLLDADNPLATPDAPGYVERAVEESFNSRVVVMHLQGAGGDVSPAGGAGFDCGREASGPAKFCFNYAVGEATGRNAVAPIRAAWEQAGMNMRERVKLETLTRTVPLGGDPRTFTVRDGGLSYAPFVPRRIPDGVVFDDAGGVAGPLIDEFNAPFGAGLCGTDGPGIYSRAAMPGVGMILPYRSCGQVQLMATLFNGLLAVTPAPFSTTEVACGATRTDVTAARIGDFVLATLPGEPVTLLADRLRALSPVAADHTIVIGYANGHVGYLLTADDWLRGGYEPSINLWGPLEGEHIVEQSAAVMRLAVSDARENASTDGVQRLSLPATEQYPYPGADPAPMAGTVPNAVPTDVFARRFPTFASAQPAPMVRRLESARFVWIGEDPLAGAPEVVLERETMTGSGMFSPVVRNSGRTVHDGDILVTWTPFPLRREGTAPRTHYWTAEFQVVSPYGMPELSDVDQRAGFPLGRYRFAVHGTGYNLNSSPFEVTGGALEVAATRMGSNVRATVNYRAAEGWRGLSLTVAPNAPVPVSGTTVTVRLTLAGGMTRDLMNVAVTPAGEITVDGTNVQRVQVTDRYGNVGEAAVGM